MLNKIINKIFGNSIEKSNPSYQWSTESQAGASVHDGGKGYEERARSDMNAERQFVMPSYQVMKRSELTQDSFPIDALGNTKKMKRW
jgi:hypothetical protein